MQLTNTRTGYGWIAIALHWISAVGMVALYFLGEALEEAEGRAARLAAMTDHVSVGVLLFTFLAARIVWSLAQPHPASLERQPLLRLAGAAVHILFLLMILALIVSGPLALWSNARPLPVFDFGVIPSPFATRNEALHEAAETVHEAASKLFWPLIILHVAGALKHLVIDRDRTLLRILRPQTR